MISGMIYFSTNPGWYETILLAIAWSMLLLGLWPLSFLMRPRRRQQKLKDEISIPSGGLARCFGGNIQ